MRPLLFTCPLVHKCGMTSSVGAVGRIPSLCASIAAASAAKAGRGSGPGRRGALMLVVDPTIV